MALGAGRRTWGVAITPDGTRAYLTTRDSTNEVLVIDTASNAVVATVPLPFGSDPLGVSIGNRAVTPEIQTVLLISQVEDLVTAGSLNRGRGRSLLAKLNRILSSLERRPRIACNALGAFVNQVNAFIRSGRLSELQGHALLGAANALRDSLGC